MTVKRPNLNEHNSVTTPNVSNDNTKEPKPGLYLPVVSIPEDSKEPKLGLSLPVVSTPEVCAVKDSTDDFLTSKSSTAAEAQKNKSGLTLPVIASPLKFAMEDTKDDQKLPAKSSLTAKAKKKKEEVLAVLIVFHDDSSKLFQCSMEEALARCARADIKIKRKFDSAPLKEQYKYKKTFDSYLNLVHKEFVGTKMADKIDIPKPNNTPVMIRFTDATTIVFEEGADYAANVLDKMSFTKGYKTFEHMPLEEMHDRCNRINSVLFQQAAEFDENPISLQVTIELTKGKEQQVEDSKQMSTIPVNEARNHPEYNLPIVTPTKIMERNPYTSQVQTELGAVNVNVTPKEKPSIQALLREKSDRGDHELFIFVAKPDKSLGWSKQVVFFDFMNAKTGKIYWSYKAMEFQNIFDQNISARELDDIFLDVFCYPKCDPKNSENKLTESFKSGSKEIHVVQYILGVVVSINLNDQQIERHIQQLIKEMLSEKCKELYHGQRLGKVNPKFSDDVKPEGQLWKSLSACSRVKQLKHISSLDELITAESAAKLVIANMLVNEPADVEKWSSSSAQIFASRSYLEQTCP